MCLTKRLLYLMILAGILPMSVFPASDDTLVFELAATRENPRNSEGAFLALRSGRILFAYTQFYQGGADESPARIVSVYSDDAGRSWSKKPEVLVENHAAQNVMSVSFLRCQSGRIALFYLVKNSLLDCRPYVQFSEDEAKSWSAPKLTVEAPGYFVLNNDRVIQLASGRLVMPLAYHRSRATDPKNYRTMDYRAITIWYLSDDEGQTWREADIWWGPTQPSRSGLQEPGVVELSNGHLFSWLRTDQGSQFGCYSTDGGISWSPPAATALQSPTSPASIKRIPGSPDLLAVYNDHSGRFPFTPKRRTPLVTAVSKDDGKTWITPAVIENDPAGSYCYTAMHFTEDALLLGYFDFRASQQNPLANRLLIRRIPMQLPAVPSTPPR